MAGKPSNSPAKKHDTPEAVVRAFLWFTIDEPHFEKAAALLDEKSRPSGHFHGEGPPTGSKYTLGDPTTDSRGRVLPVTISLSNAQAPVTMHFVLVQEGTPPQWKIDLAATMKRAVAHQTRNTLTPAEPKPPEPRLPTDRLNKFRTTELPDFQTSLQKDTRSKILIDIDLDSLLYHPTAAENSNTLDALAGSVFNNLGYALREAHAKFPLKNRVAVVRLERALPDSPQGRAVFADNSRIIYRLDPNPNPRSDSLSYYTSDLEQILPALIAGMPQQIDPRTPSVPGPVSFLPTLTADPLSAATHYRDHTAPEIANRTSALLKSPVSIEFDHKSITTPAALEGLLLWGPSRIPGALAILCQNQTDGEEIRALLASALQTVRFESLSSTDVKSIQLSSGTLLIRVNFSTGESGAFYEHEIASLLRAKLHLAERPQIENVRKEALHWQKELDDYFRHPITFSIDFDGFISHPDPSTNVRGLYMLKEHGVDALYYAITNVANENPNFKQQFTDRIDTLKLVHVPDPKDAGLSAENATLIYKLSLHSGYTGYLTIEDLSDLLPALVASLPDESFTLRDPREPLQFNRPDDDIENDDDDQNEDEEESDDAELAELNELRELAKEDQQRLVDEEEEQAEEEREKQNTESSARQSAFEQVRQNIAAALPVYAAQMQQIVGKPIPISIDWPSLDNDPLAIGELLNAGLAPILGGLAVLGADAEIRRKIHAAIDSITLRRAASAKEHGFSLGNATLTFTAFLTPSLPPTDPHFAATLLRNLLTSYNPQSTTPAKKQPKEKPAPKKSAKPKPAAKSPPSKSPAKKSPPKRKK